MGKPFSKIAIRILISTFTLGSLYTRALAWDWDAPDHGYLISVSTTNGIPQHSGQAAAISGQIRLSGVDGRELEGGRKFRDELPSDQVQVHAYFPDQTTEVTSSLVWTGNQFQFTTPALNPGDLNHFMIQVSNVDPLTGALQRIESKLDERIQDLTSALSKEQEPLVRRHPGASGDLSETSGDLREDLSPAFRLAGDFGSRDLPASGG